MFKNHQRIWVLTVLLGLFFLTGCSSAKSGSTASSSSSSAKTSRKATSSSSSTTKKTSHYANWHHVAEVKIPILMYHSISSGNSLRVPAKEFKAEMHYLKQHHYYTLTAKEAVYAFKHHRLPQKKVVWITLDDSYKDNLTKALPILKKYQLHATINFITGFTKKSNHLTLAEAKKMVATGDIDFQSHTVSHLDLNELTYRQQFAELNDSKKWLDKNLHQNTAVICYPAGRANKQTIKAAKAAGYSYALSTSEGIATSKENPYNLTRQRVVPGMSLQGFASLLK